MLTFAPWFITNCGAFSAESAQHSRTDVGLKNKTMNTECPKCGSEDAFFNGVCYECPACDYEWEADNCVFEEER